METARDFSTISPSAYSLLMLKGLTAIPYAREAAAILLASRPDLANAINSRYSRPADANTSGASAADPNPSGSTAANPNPSDPNQRPPLFWARMLHFENRYWSIDQLMQPLGITNVLELSSGFSFRGLALSKQEPVYYIDTDLPDLITVKKQFINALTREGTPATDTNPNHTAAGPESAATTSPGHYELRPLNVLDEPAFDSIVDSFPPGQLLIVNEGLLVYLEPAEKETLCRIIRKVLQRRGGYWITGDIYIQKDIDPAFVDRQDAFHQFLQQHKIEEKKFPDFEGATEFFTRMGFIVDREAITDLGKLTAFPRLIASLNPETQKKLSQMPKMHAIWRLRPAGN